MEHQEGPGQPTQWRARDAGPGIRLVVLVSLVVVGGQAAWDLARTPAGSGRGGAALGLVLVVLVAVTTAVCTARMRVRVLDEGIEIRQLWTRLHRWSDVTDVDVVRRGGGVRAVRIALRNGSTRVLPTPTTNRRGGASEVSVAAAVAAVERHLAPGRSPVLPGDTSLDDLLRD